MKFLTNKQYKQIARDLETLEEAQRSLKYERSRREDAEKRLDNIDQDYRREMEIQEQNHQKELDGLTADHENELTTIELRKDKEYNARLREAETRAMGKEAEIKGLEKVVKAQEDSMERMKEQMEFLCGLIPTVDLSKLNFSVTNNQQVQPVSK